MVELGVEHTIAIQRYEARFERTLMPCLMNCAGFGRFSLLILKPNVIQSADLSSDLSFPMPVIIFAPDNPEPVQAIVGGRLAISSCETLQLSSILSKSVV